VEKPEVEGAKEDAIDAKLQLGQLRRLLG